MTNHTTSKIKILILAAHPSNTGRRHLDTDRRRLDEEVREIKASLERSPERERFDIQVHMAVRDRDVRRALSEYEPEIVHFSGHGGIGLLLENQQGQARLVSATALASLFDLSKGKVKCVVLNTCYLEEQAQAIHQHIDYVIGISPKLNDRAAIEFAVGFYDVLWAGRSYEEAYQSGLISIKMLGVSGNSAYILHNRAASTLPNPVISPQQPIINLPPDPPPLVRPVAPRRRSPHLQDKRKPWAIGGLVTGLLLVIFWIFWMFFPQKLCPVDQVQAKGQCVSKAVLPTPVLRDATRFSSGEQVLFKSNSNSSLGQGIIAFKAGDYTKAERDFQNAVKTSPKNEPEPQIYLNNAKARAKGTPYVIAAVVSIDSDREDLAKEMLRGVADAQIKFNNVDKGKDDRLLEVLIVNDSQESIDPQKSIAAEVAQTLASPAYSNILGVIGHSASENTAAALDKYIEANLAIVTPRATKTLLSGKTFFRVVPSARKISEKLANYAAYKLSIKKVATFFNGSGEFSPSFKDSFVTAFTEAGGSQAIEPVNLDHISNTTEVEQAVQQSIKNGAEALVLIPTADSPNILLAISVAEASKKALLQGQKLELLGANSLYDPKTLEKGGEAIENMVLAVPWFATSENPYAKAAKARWGGQVSWSTAASFDATKALIATLSKTVSRDDVLERLKKIDLPREETSGERLKFDIYHERAIEPVLVQVTRTAPNKPVDFAVGFDLLRPN